MNFRVSLACCALLLVYGCGGGGGDDRNQAPQIIGLGDVTVNANETSAPFSFTVSDDGGADAVRLSATSGNEDLLPDDGISIAGSGSNRTFTVTPVPGRLGSAPLVVTALDGAGLRTSVSLQVDVITQSVSFSDFFRDTFNQPANAAPRDLNSREFGQDAGSGDFDDLLGDP
jgi:hypothetical protein